MMNSYRFLPLLPVMGTLLFGTGCTKRLAPLNPAAPAPTMSEPATVTLRDIVGQVLLEGETIVPPFARVGIKSPYRAPVSKVNTTLGAAVSQGDVLIELSLPSAEAYHEQTKLALQQAETDYAIANKQFQADVDVAREHLNTARATEKAATPEELPIASSARSDAEQVLLQTKLDKERALLPYRRQQEQMRQLNQQARAGEKQGYIRTPLTGTVTELNAQPGKEVGTDKAAFVATVVDLSALQVQSPMTLQQSGYVKPKMEVLLTFKELPGTTFEGTVHRLTSLPNSKGLVALIEFKNTKAQVKPAMVPHVAVKTGQSAKNTLCVPSAAVDINRAGLPVVQVMQGGKWAEVVVKVGITDDQFTEIKSGVSKGDTVLVTP
ncbi:efflux RND transporter periplasmic adaptor subunit [Armatimonas sp.]|uniref:efflux RND transporter periplasmic adaptor subunit n=1 Tax=Armatimonas sp. TaxID=1872638 RepID=UPI00374DF4C5